MRVLNTAQMREADRRTIEEIGIPSVVLMETAGRQVVAAIESTFDDRLTGRVAVVCGRGNNGGDGFVVARTLRDQGVDVSVFVLGPRADVRGDARLNLDILGRLGVAVVEIADAQAWDPHTSEIAACSLIVDAIVGTGFRDRLTGLLEAVVASINTLDIPVVAIDLPSGLSADTPDVSGLAVEAAMTVALGALKLPLVLPPGEGYAGDVVVAAIGIPDEVFESLDGPYVELITPESLRAYVGPRSADSHKGDFGRVTIVAGSRGKAGAAALAAMGALRSGAGTVTVAMPASSQTTVAALAPEYMTSPLDEAGDGGLAGASVDVVLAMSHDVIVCGPGLGRSPGVAAFVHALLDRATVPLVLDADALMVLADNPGALRGRDDRAVIITPHPGEMARLLDRTVDDVQRNRLLVAREFAVDHRVYVVLKGHRTIVAAPDGRTFINPTGNPGMATGGTGDVLAGAIGAWMAQILDAEAACRLGVFLHGSAGDLAAEAEGQVAMTAGDVVRHLGAAWQRLAEPERSARTVHTRRPRHGDGL
jgi:ADP-dependent NAD(P)H-hydrate dehydratase / NAD(P)H-hydrate epimerase